MTEWCDRDPTSIAPGGGPSKVQQDLGRAFFVIRSRGSRQKNSDNPKASHRSSKACRAESRFQHFMVLSDSHVGQLISFAVDRALARDMPTDFALFSVTSGGSHVPSLVRRSSSTSRPSAMDR